MPASPLISVILATHNRRDITVVTIGRVLACAAPGCELEVIAVDNASTDDTADAIERRFPTVSLIRASANLGSCAKALGVPEARGRFVLFCDDDSYPRPGSIQRMVRHFDDDPQLGAAGFRVHLPDGSQESGALPHMFVGCAVGLRTRALQAVGGLDRDLFMQAEEYHLAFRLVNAGWAVRLFDDLHADHLKTPKARRTSRTTFYDTRNNLLLAARYLPPPYHAAYARDWRQRYGWLAQASGHRATFRRGCVAGTLQGWLNRLTDARDRLSSTAMETLFQLDFVARRMHEIRAGGARRIVLADLGKNVYAYHQGAARAGLGILAVADDGFAAPGRAYRGTPILTLGQALQLDPDAVVIANMSPAHAERTHRRLTELTSLPVLDWFSRPLATEPGSDRALRPAAV